jgi:hypothetical protein
MATMTRKRTKTRMSEARVRQAESGPALGGLAIVASALVHIAQATRNADLEKDKDRLLDVLRAWQAALTRERTRVVDLQRLNESLRQANATMTDHVAQLEQEKAHLETLYATTVKELDALEPEASATAEVTQ